MQTKNGLKILFVSAEVAPFAKTGGLADVAGSLPQELSGMGHDVRVVMPKYKIIESKMDYVTDFPVIMGEKKETCIVKESKMSYNSKNSDGDIPIYFLDNYNYYDREGIYCYMDDADRFIFLCRAALEMLPRIDFQPDIIHCNDWHTGPVCLMLKEQYAKDPFYKDIATVFTIHNLEYQGHFSKDVISLMNLDDEVFTPDKVEFYGMFNFMKAGLVYSDIINTVSQAYAEEIKTEKYGERLEGLLNKRSKDLYGIVNGISYEEFNPSKDTRIYKTFSQETYKDKIVNKHGLQKEVGLPISDKPLIGVVHRLTAQKGLELVLDVMDNMMENDIQFVMLGIGDSYYENKFMEFSKKYPDKMKVFIEFNVELAQKIYAGADMFLMPSRFEPCGLGQLISLRYGTIPVVRSTGGLADTIVDYNKNSKNGNGFVFEDYSSDKFFDALKRALELYSSSPDMWQELVKKALKLDFSWKIPAKKYEELYKLALKKDK